MVYSALPKFTLSYRLSPIASYDQSRKKNSFYPSNCSFIVLPLLFFFNIVLITSKFSSCHSVSWPLAAVWRRGPHAVAQMAKWLVRPCTHPYLWYDWDEGIASICTLSYSRLIYIYMHASYTGITIIIIIWCAITNFYYPWLHWVPCRTNEHAAMCCHPVDGASVNAFTSGQQWSFKPALRPEIATSFAMIMQWTCDSLLNKSFEWCSLINKFVSLFIYLFIHLFVTHVSDILKDLTVHNYSCVGCTLEAAYFKLFAMWNILFDHHRVSECWSLNSGICLRL